MYMTIYGHSVRICGSGQLGVHIWAYLQSDWCLGNCDITVLGVISKLGLHIWAHMQSDWCVESCDIRAECKLVMSEQTGVLRVVTSELSKLVISEV